MTYLHTITMPVFVIDEFDTEGFQLDVEFSYSAASLLVITTKAFHRPKALVHQLLVHHRMKHTGQYHAGHAGRQ